MTAVLLGLASATAYGAADFFGGLTNRRAPLLAVVGWSQFVGLAVLTPVVLVLGLGTMSASVGLWGAGAGVAGLAGVALLYHGLAVGTMSVVAPVAGLLGAGVPLLWGLATGERPAVLAFVGMAVALVAIVLVSRGDGKQAAAGAARGIGAGAGAGAAFGVMYILLAGAGESAGLWPVIIARATASTIVGVVALVTARLPVVPRAGYAGVAATGVLDMLANTLFVLATGSGLVSIVAVLSSLYPAATVILAGLFLHERLARSQIVGLGAAALGVVFIAVG